MNEQKKEKNESSKIRKRAITQLSAVALLIIVFMALVMGSFYFYSEADYYENELTLYYAKSIAEYVDGDAVERYINGGEKDAYYDEVQNIMESYFRNSELLSYYIYVPNQEQMHYIWVAGCQDGHSHGEYKGGSANNVTYTNVVFDGDLSILSKIMRDTNHGLITCSVYPIYNSNHEIVALASADMSISFILSNVTWFVSMIIIGIIIVIAIYMVLLYVVMNRLVIEPVLKLNKATKGIVEKIEAGEEIHLDIQTGNEIEELAASFERMNTEIQQYIKKYSKIMSEKGRIDTELGIATRIQAHLLPSIFPAFPERTEFDLFASMTPAKEVGGDFYDFFFVDEDHLALVMADVSGKGIPAALYMMVSKTIIKNCAQGGMSPADVLISTNNLLCENNDEDMFVTVWIGILEISTGKMTCSNAGHEYPILCMDGEYTVLKDKHGFVIGGFEEMTYSNYEIQFKPGDKLFVYTDGIPEATNSEQKLFGLDKLVSTLNQNKDDNVKDLVAHVHGAVDEFVGQADQFDDLTMLAFTYLGKETE